MAIEREIPNDIKAIKPKIAGGFTTRQCLCLAPILAAAFVAFLVFKEWQMPAKIIFLLIFIVPFGLIGWKEVYGLPFEKFMVSIFISTFLAPPKRKYKSVRLEDLVDDDQPKAVEKRKKKAAKKKKTTDPLLRPHL